jgi:hypothetical protein
MDVDYQAAWVPFNDGDLELPVEFAVEWVERECAEQNAVGLLVTPQATIDGLVEGIVRSADVTLGHATLDFTDRHAVLPCRPAAPE